MLSLYAFANNPHYCISISLFSKAFGTYQSRQVIGTDWFGFKKTTSVDGSLPFEIKSALKKSFQSCKGNLLIPGWYLFFSNVEWPSHQLDIQNVLLPTIAINLLTILITELVFFFPSLFSAIWCVTLLFQWPFSFEKFGPLAGLDDPGPQRPHPDAGPGHEAPRHRSLPQRTARAPLRRPIRSQSAGVMRQEQSKIWQLHITPLLVTHSNKSNKMPQTIWHRFQVSF